MAKGSPIINSFNGGEFSPLMAGRADLKYYANGCRRIRNFIPTVQGPARRRPGARFVAEIKASANRSWLWKFEFNVEQAYVLEFGNQYIRFFSNHGVVGAPFEVTTPYTTADLTGADGTFQLRFVQSSDVLYITHPKYAPRKLTRTGAATFVLSVLEPEGGPFEDVDPTQTTTVYASAASGAITATASSAIFLPTHVGARFYMEQRNADTVSQWITGTAYAAGARCRSDGKNYTTAAGGTTGTVKPTHTVGTKQDGAPGVAWTFEDSGYGWGKITAIGGAGTTATITTESNWPGLCVGVANATTRWAFGAWSDEKGWPDNITFFRERLCLSRDRKIWQSVSGDFENFRRKDDGGVVTAEQAIVSDITSDRANRIEWLAPSDVALLVGSAGDEASISEISGTAAFGPGNVRARKQTEYGSRHVQPARVGDGVVFPQKSGRKVRSMSFDWRKEGFRAPDVTILADHVTKGGIIGMAYQQEPDSTVWAHRSDGALLGLTLNDEQEVKGWHPHRIGGYSNAANTEFAKVESMVCIPSPDGDRDELWMIVNRYINGAVKRYVEWLEYHHEEGDDPEDAFYVDSGLTLNNTKAATLTPGANATVKASTGVIFQAGSAIFAAGDVTKKIHYRYKTLDIAGKITWKTAVAEITQFDSDVQVRCRIDAAFPNLDTIASNGWRLTVTAITGLGHLEGQTVAIWANGSHHPTRVVTGGSITLAHTNLYSKIHVGLQCTAVLQPMPLEAAAADGTAQGKKQRVSRVVIRFHETAGCRYGRDEEALLGAGEKLDRVETRAGGTNMDEAPPLYTGDKTVGWPDGHSSDDKPALMTIIADQAGPCTIVAILPQLVTQDSK